MNPSEAAVTAQPINMRDAADTPSKMKKPFYRQLYVQVLFAILLGVIVGVAFPDFATTPAIKALGDGFIKLIKMVIAPIIFCTVSTGIAHIQDAKKVGRVGVKALVYFEVVSTFALVIGLVIGNVVQPGAGFGGQPDAVGGRAICRARRTRPRSISSSTSSPIPSSAPSPAAISSRSCCSRS